MPVSLKYPGVYVQELPSSVRPIVGVPTSVAAFVGPAPRGPQDHPLMVTSFAQYERTFGPLEAGVPLSVAVYLFFLNGGGNALVVRTSTAADVTASAQLSPSIKLEAASAGTWGTTLTATVDTAKLVDTKHRFNLTIKEDEVVRETYPGVTLTQGSAQYLPNALAASQLVVPAAANTYADIPAAKDYPFTAAEPPPPPASGAGADAAPTAAATPADAPPAPPSVLGDNATTGIYALAKADIFNILVLPGGASPDDFSTVAAFCVLHRAMVIVDPPSSWPETRVPDFETITGKPALTTTSANAAVYYPNLKVSDQNGGTITTGPAAAVAGVWAATDAQRGVWKAPAGTAATLTGVRDLAVHLIDEDIGQLNPYAVNAVRIMPEIGPVVWGARTSVGSDELGDQNKYVPVIRTTLFIEESLRRGTQWVVFEPNDEPLWSSIRLNVGAFMNGLFRQGAFQGTTPADAYLVKCDADNNPQDQIDLGIVNILVGFAPLKPAEFVIISLQQQAGQS